MAGAIIQLKNIHKNFYLTKENKVSALVDINLDINKKEFISIIGPSGSGKSTLLNLVGLLDKPDKNQGQIIINGFNIANVSNNQLARLRRDTIGFVFQTFNLLPRLSALENVRLPLRYAKAARKESLERAGKLLKQVGLGKRMHHKPAELSGGEKQRVAIARALANNPQIILADEPTGNLDSKAGQEIIAILKKLNTEQNVTLIIVTHDASIAAQADRTIKIQDGKIC